MTLLKAQSLVKTYSINNQPTHVVNDVSLDIKQGETIIILGKSGSGKSTLLSLLSGLDKPSKGKITLNDQDITNATEDELAKLRNSFFGFIFQSFHLVPSLTAIENIAFPNELAKKNFQAAQKKAEKALLDVGLEKRRDNFPHQLSGGEKQRVAIARAIINNPKVIFADEPTGNLDSKTGDQIIKLLQNIKKEHNTTLIIVTHNEDLKKIADRVITMSDGKIKK